MREAAQKFVGDHDYRNFCKVIDNNIHTMYVFTVFGHGVVSIVCPQIIHVSKQDIVRVLNLWYSVYRLGFHSSIATNIAYKLWYNSIYHNLYAIIVVCAYMKHNKSLHYSCDCMCIYMSVLRICRDIQVFGGI